MPGPFATRLMLETLWFSGGASLVEQKWRGLGSILMLHRVEKPVHANFSPNAHLSVSPQFLDKLLSELSNTIYKFASMDEFATRLDDHHTRQNERPLLAVTLDDGYRDNLENAIPIFRKHSIPYTIYIAPGLVDGRATLWWEDLENLISARDSLYFDWKGRRREFDLSTVQKKYAAYGELLKYLTVEVDEHHQREIVSGICEMYQLDPQKHRKQSIMHWQELRELAEDPLCTLGAHTIGHYALARLSEEQARTEFGQSRSIIAHETGVVPEHFAYPYGYPAAAGEREFQMAADLGFKTAVTTRHGVVYREHGGHKTALPRISLNGNFQKSRYVRTMISGATTRLVNKGGKLNLD